ncbi:Cilia- and flagella-associated protein 47, partial [Larimichthys crocea]
GLHCPVSGLDLYTLGQSCVENVVLQNNAPQACDWVCLLQETTAGTEAGTYLQKTIDAVPTGGNEEVQSSQPRRFSGNSSVELAVTGSGLPVSLVPSSSQFDFLSCVTGQRVDLLCVLHNLCPKLPVNFRFRKLVHFSTKPSSGTISPGQCQDVVLSFTARQQGSFQVCQKLDVLGYVAPKGGSADGDVTGLQLCSFHTITLHLSAVCCSETTHPVPKLNPGITPAVTNPTGSRPHVQSSKLSHCHRMARAAVLCANKTRLHVHRREKSQITEGEEFLAFPNDRATSIRPASANRQYRTIFTGVHRYRYIDTNYALTEEEEKQRQHHRQVYADFIKQLRETRLQKAKDRQQEKVDDNVDIGIVPSQGLIPPALHISDLESNKITVTKPNDSYACSATKRSCQVTSITRKVNNQVSEVMNTVPSTSQEVADCNRTLTAQELYQVNIGPLFVDFGEVCVQSVCVQKLELTNHLSVFVWVQLEVDCPELQGSSPLSHVLPPHSHNTLPLMFQSNKLGSFHRPISYTVNQQHPGQIVVQAHVVPLALELSTILLVLRPTPALLAQSGYRSSVTLRNQRNHAAEFTWRPVVTENGILFSIRPATGTVEPFSELDCEVVWHPSSSAPSEGDFDLCVHEGNSQRLHCVAKVMDVCPLPGMVVGTPEGVVPSGGQAVLKIHFNPESLIKFDTTIEIALRNMKSIELRVGGSVEPPDVDINVSQFQFYSVHAGSHQAIPFILTNRSSAAVQVTFDLSEYTDFSLKLPQPSSKKEPGVSVVELQGHQAVDCSLIFSPTQVASYDFDLPLMVNGVRWPPASLSHLSPPSSSSTSSSFLSAGSRKHVVKPLPQSVTMVTSQSPCIQATVLCAPLEISPSSLEFSVEPLTPPSDAHTKTVELTAVCADSVFWRSGTREHVNWWFDCSATAVPTEDRREGELCSGRVTKLSIPLYLGDRGGEGMEGEERHQPYRELSVTITLQFPSITIHPPQILLTPVPLETVATATLTLLASGYPSGTSLSAEVDEVKMEDGTKMQPVSVIFPDGHSIPAQQQHQNKEAGVTPLTCSVSFCCGIPLSLCTTITFTDHLHNRFKVKLCALADSCLLTVWPFMALHRSEQQIVLKTGSTAVEAILQHYHTPSPARGHTSSSSSSFDHNSSTNKNSTSDSFPNSDSVRTGTPVNLGVPEFPAANSDEGVYCQNVLLAVERWFSLFGWPSGPHPISVPHTLRRVVSKIQTNRSSGRAYRVIQNKDSRSVVDMLQHLTGKQIPGIPRCQTFSADLDQRTNQLLQQHEATLAFLRVQGASLCHIRPEYLLDMEEFKHWCSLQSDEQEHGPDYTSVDYECLSKRSWTDVLLQIYKVLVLCHVPERNLKTTLNLKDVDGILPVSSQPLASNVYSSQELQLLLWLNMHYQSMRKIVWRTGGVPSARWIVNFDLDLTDGLVLAALLAAYCPYLICSHFRRMYATTSSPEQILHNNIIVSQALNVLCLNIDIQSTVKCKSPCYQLKVIQVPITNSFNKEGTFRVVLVESPLNPLEPEKKKDSIVQQASSKANLEKMTSDESCEEMEEKCSDLNGEDNEFVCAVGDMIYMIKATAEMPFPSPLSARPSSNIVSIPNNSVDPAVCVSVLRLLLPDRAGV